jgi:cytochrome c oxidase assembly factor CtaG
MIFIGLGSLLILIGVIWMVVIAIQTGQTTGEKALWAIVNLICQPIGGIVFYIVKKQGLIPLILIIVGYIIFAPGYYSVINEAMKNMPR